jgi:hypothetical protein
MRHDGPFPGAEADVNTYFGTVAGYLDANKVRLGISTANTDALAVFFLVWSGAFPPSQVADTRTKTITDAKDASMKDMKTTLRDIYSGIADSVLTFTDRNTLNLPERSANTRVPAMGVSPDINMKHNSHLEHEIHTQNPDTPATIAMPRGQHILLQYFVGAAGLTGAAITFDHVLILSRANNIISFTNAQVGLTCYYQVCYQNAHKESGPMSATFSAIII